MVILEGRGITANNLCLVYVCQWQESYRPTELMTSYCLSYEVWILKMIIADLYNFDFDFCYHLLATRISEFFCFYYNYKKTKSKVFVKI